MSVLWHVPTGPSCALGQFSTAEFLVPLSCSRLLKALAVFCQGVLGLILRVYGAQAVMSDKASKFLKYVAML